jgi:hypothetical protein
MNIILKMYGRTKLLRRNIFFLALLSFSLSNLPILQSKDAWAQTLKKNIGHGPKISFDEVLPMLINMGKKDTGVIDTSPYIEIWLENSFNWTTATIHRADNYDLFQLILPGSIASNFPNHWTLAPCSSQANFPPQLYLIEDVLRGGVAMGTVSIPLTWEIALDGGSFNPMTLMPDNTLTTTCPPGPHTFQVRITGTPQYHQADGYYRLQLTQSLVPQL